MFQYTVTINSLFRFDFSISHIDIYMYMRIYVTLFINMSERFTHINYLHQLHILIIFIILLP